MKKIYFKLTFCLISFCAFVQNDSIFPNVKGEWYMDYVMFDVDPWRHYYGNLTIKKLDQNYDTMALYSDENHLANFYTDSLQVYFKRGSDTLSLGYTFEFYTGIGYEYEVIYDFSLNQNDTAYFDYRYGQYAVVTNIDTLIFEGQKRKKYYLSNGDRWIQGIGSLKHPLFSKINYCFECEVEVCSVNLEYEGISPIDTLNYIVNNCPYASIDEKDLNLFKIYPNPLQSDILILEFDELTKPDEIRIRDTKLSLISSQDNISSTKQLSINTEKLVAGIYFLEIKKDKLSIIKRFVKI